MPKLHLLSGDDIAATIDITGDLLTIGRTEDNGLCIEDDSISKAHGILVRDGDDYQIHDFNSTNGTWVNGTRILAVKLKHGDQIRLGFVNVRYESITVPPTPRLKLGGGATRIAPTVAATPAPTVAPAPLAVASPPTAQTPPAPQRRTLGGKTPAGSSAAAPPAPPPPTPRPVAPAAPAGDRVFINIPDLPPEEPVAPSESGLQEKLRASQPVPKPSLQPSVQLNKPVRPTPRRIAVPSEPAPVALPVPEPAPAPALAPVPPEYEVVPQLAEPVVKVQAVEQIPEAVVAETPPAPPVEKKIPTAAGSPKGEVRLRPTVPGGTGEKKLSFKPAAPTPRDQLRFGPKKSGDAAPPTPPAPAE